MRKMFCVLLLLLSACGTVQIKDDEFCADKGSLGAACATMLTDKIREIDHATWENYRFGMLCETSGVFSDLKVELEQTCSKCNCCTEETQAALKAAASAMDYVFLKAQKLKAYQMKGAK